MNSIPFDFLHSPSPIICQCFIAHFQEYENVQMQQMTAVSLDHTFKIASADNIVCLTNAI